MRVGIYVYGLATVAAGIVNLVWGDFEPAHQPIQAFGDHILGREMFAYVGAISLIAGGATILWRRTARAGAAVAAVVYLAFAVFWLPRFYTATQVLGARLGIYMGLLSGVAQQLTLVAGAAVVYASLLSDHSTLRERLGNAARWTLGVSSVVFGLAHLNDIQAVARMVPTWMPLGGSFWTVITGVAFILAGVAILTRVQEILAGRLLALMLLVFSAFVLVPPLFGSPPSHVAWGSNAYNLTAAGTVWVFAGFLANRYEDRGTDAAAGLAAVS